MKINNKVKLGLLKIAIIPIGFAITQTVYSSNSSNLLEIYQLAAQQDPKLQQAFANFKSVEQNIPIAVADLLPEVTLNAGMSYDKILNFRRNESVRQEYFNLNFTQPIFYWDRINRYLQSELEVEKAIHDLEAAKEDLLIRVSEAYFNVLEAEDTLEHTNTEKISVKQLYDQQKEKFKVGYIAIADVDEAKARYELKLSDEIAAKNKVDTRYDELIQIVNQKIEHLSILTPVFKPSKPKPADMNQWVKMSVAQNHDLKSAMLDEKVHEKNIDIAFAGHLPSGDFTARYRGVHSDRSLILDEVSTSKGYLESIGAAIEGRVEIYGGGGTQAKVEKAQHDTCASKFNTEKVKRETMSNTKQAYRNVLTSINQILALEQAVISGLSALEATKAGYELGTRASVDVLDRLTDLYNQKQKLSAVRYAYIKNVIQLKKLSGVLTPNDIRTVDSWLVTKSDKLEKMDQSEVKSKVLQTIKQRDTAIINSAKSTAPKDHIKKTDIKDPLPTKVEKSLDKSASQAKPTQTQKTVIKPSKPSEEDSINQLEEKFKQLEKEPAKETEKEPTPKKSSVKKPEKATTTAKDASPKIESKSTIEAKKESTTETKKDTPVKKEPTIETKKDASAKKELTTETKKTDTKVIAVPNKKAEKPPTQETVEHTPDADTLNQLEQEFNKIINEATLDTKSNNQDSDKE